MILNLLKFNFKNSEIRYPNARKCIRMLEWSIRCQKEHSDTLEAIFGLLRRMHRGGIWMLETEFGCSRGHSDTLYKLLHGRYPDAGKCIQILIEAIRILEESIRMLATQNHEQR